MRKSMLIVLALLSMLILGRVLADSPSLMTYQGVLLDGSGNALVNSTQNVTFRIFDEEAIGTGTQLWIQNFPSLTTDATGSFTVIFSNLNQTDFNDTALWLEIQVSPDPPMDPRQRLTSAPYAIRAGGAWSLRGNENPLELFYVGTNDNTPLVLKVNEKRVLQINPPTGDFVLGDEAPSIIGGHENNTVADTADGATISGGGYYNLWTSEDFKNRITHDFGTIGGGADNKVFNRFGSIGGGRSNTAGGEYSTVPGGQDCSAAGDHSFAAGFRAKAQHNGSFVWGDATDALVASTEENQFKVRASNGVVIGGGVDSKIKVQNASNNTSILLDGGTGELSVGGPIDGTVYVKDAAGVGAIQLKGSNHVVRMENSLAEQTIRLDGENGTLKMYASGSTTESIRLNAESCTITTGILRITGGCDIAEPFLMTDNATLPEGSVVVIDRANPGHTTLSSEPYDPCVAGIISGAGGVNPGLTLSQEGILEAGQNVALTGRVYCLATASNGAIKPGDMLTTSQIPGHAMKVTDRVRAYGAIIGKAMTPLAGGEGLIMVLVSLQ